MTIVSLGLFAQEDTTSTEKKQLFVVLKTDGNEYIGYILKDDGREVLLETENLGKIYIPKSQIKNITKVEDEKLIQNGSYNTEGPFTTRYTFTTNALPIKKGEDYALVNLYGPEVHFAVSDNFNIGVMTSWIASPFVLAMKYSMKTGNENINLSAGLLAGSSGYLNSFRGYGGLAFGNITFGDRRRNITFSAGYLFIDPNASRTERFAKEGIYQNNNEYFYSYDVPSSSTEQIKNNTIASPMFSIGGYHKVSKRASFIFDSMIGILKPSLEENITTTEVSAPVGSPWDSFYIPGVYDHRVTHSKGGSTVMFYFMPGMRFQKTENRAFQFNLAGVTVIESNGDIFSFPVPTLGWYFKF